MANPYSSSSHSPPPLQHPAPTHPAFIPEPPSTPVSPDGYQRFTSSPPQPSWAPHLHQIQAKHPPIFYTHHVFESNPRLFTVRGHTPHRVEERQTRPRPLKRSASTASLLTPPRTVQQKSRKRSKSRGSDEEESDDDDDADAERDGGPSVQRVLFAGRKRQRTERLDAVLASLSDDEQKLSSPVTFRINKAPVSPPPSRRQSTKSKASTSSSSSSSQAEMLLASERER